MAEFAEMMKKDNYSLVTTKFALARGLLTMRCAKAKKFSEDTMGATLALKNSLSPGEENRVKLDTVVPILQATSQQFARWKRSAARSGANYALALMKAHFLKEFTTWRGLARAILKKDRAAPLILRVMLRLPVVLV